MDFHRDKDGFPFSEIKACKYTDSAITSSYENSCNKINFLPKPYGGFGMGQ